MQISEERILKRGRTMYILYAALEYLIALAVSGSFLAKLTTEIGMTDSQTGIIASITSLGGLFQLLNMFVHKCRVKRYVIMLTSVSQLLHIFLYLIPRLAMGRQVSSFVFAVTMVVSSLLTNLAAPKRSSWLMSLVADKERGIFSAYKEMFSLVMGMAFSFGMGALFDWLEGMGKIQTAFGLMIAVMSACMILSALCLMFTAEKPLPAPAAKPSILRTVRDLSANRRLRAVVALYILYFVINNAAIPFYGTYQLNELGFNLKLISGFGILSSVARMIVSPYWGRLADRTSFASMLEKCFLLLGLSFLFVALATPANGIWMFALYYIVHGIAMGGVNSGMFNLVFDCASLEERADALAICKSVSGVSGFLTTLLFSAVVTALQQSGNQLFGITVYAQQILSTVSLVLTMGAVVFIRSRMKEKSIS